jgi:hypothetical protein
MLQELHLLPIQRENADLGLVDSRSDERFSKLPNKFGFRRILDIVTGTRIQGGYGVRVHEDGSATEQSSNYAEREYWDKKKTNLSLTSASNQQFVPQFKP